MPNIDRHDLASFNNSWATGVEVARPLDLHVLKDAERHPRLELCAVAEAHRELGVRCCRHGYGESETTQTNLSNNRRADTKFEARS